MQGAGGADLMHGVLLLPLVLPPSAPHHSPAAIAFVPAQDDDYTSNSDGPRVVVTYDEPTIQHQEQQEQQHPAMAGNGAYRPGFWNKTVPENSPMSMDPLPLPDSPGSVSMELTQPTLAVAVPPQQQQPGEVTAGLPSLGALAEADELEAAEEQHLGQQQQQSAAAPAPGEVTAALPSLGALAEADEWQQGGGEALDDGWAGFATAGVGGANVTANITAALPGLGALVAEDEDATAGMDLTMPAGRVLEHHPQQASPAPAAAISPAPAAAAAPSPALSQPEQHPALVPAEAAPAAAELEPTAPVAIRLSSGTDELAEAKAGQLNKWGFAPGQDDTLEINMEKHGAGWVGREAACLLDVAGVQAALCWHSRTCMRRSCCCWLWLIPSCPHTHTHALLTGRMIMGDQTFNHLYCDNSTGDSRYDRPGAGDDTGNSLLVTGGEEEAEEEGGAAAAATSPAPQQLAPPSPAAAAPAGPFGQGAVPNWTAPAFLPPYMQAPAASGGAPSDHPALVHSPDVTNSSLNTLETRRVSVDARRMSINSRRFSMQDATGRLLADDLDASLGATGGLPAPGSHLAHHLATVAEAPGSAGGAADSGPASGTRSRRRSSGAQCEC